MELEKSHQISIVSQRPDVIAFCGAVIGNMLLVKSYSDLSQRIIESSELIFIDTNLLASEKNEKLLLANQKFFSKFIFLIPALQNMDSSFEKILPLMTHVFPYPCEIERIRNYYSKILIESDQFHFYTAFADYDFDSEEKLLKETFIGESQQIRILRSELIKASKNDGPVLLLGETGVGKTTAAKLIHQFSSRRENQFITKAASEFQDGLIDSALFGTKEGAFTGARNRDGLLQIADGGTFFLDEIGLASKEMQGKLLLVIESGCFYSLGAEKTIKSDVRMIFATNENLKKKIAEGTFKSDLYFRMEHNIIRFPPLRECREDIGRIAIKTAGAFGKKINFEAIRKLEEYDWPGNSRQLITYVEKACERISSDEIKAQDIRLEF